MAEFDEFSGSYDVKLSESLGGIADIDLAVSSKLDLIGEILTARGTPRVGTMLDFGCGIGLLSRHLDRFADDVLGLDVSLASLRKSVAPAVFRIGYDGKQIPLQEKTLDVSVASCVFHHIPPASRVALAAQIFQALKPGGAFILIEHNPLNPVTRIVVNRCEFDRDAILLHRKEAVRLMQSAGFSAIESRYFFAIPPVRPWLRSLDRRLGAIALGAQYATIGQKSICEASTDATA